ncbi:MAG: DUF2313 domain-containing protein [Selenomonadaceae bacterium]|nr:DUF2313 domain-containing protein [Selenomonadaceae bacterium]
MTIIRDYLVELQKYLPEFLRQDPEMKAILEVESKEHRVQVEVLKDIQAQMFIESATWGLSLFEKNLGLQPNASDNYEQRRNRILIYLQQHKTVNKQFIEELFSRYVSGDSKIKVVEDNPNNTFWVIDTGGRIIYPEDLREAIETYKPAHLRYGLEMRRDISLTEEDMIRLAIASLFSGYRHIGIALPEEERIILNASIIPAKSGVISIGTGPEKFSEEFVLGVRFGHGFSGKRDIDADKDDLPEVFLEKAARIAPILGIATDIIGVHILPLEMPEKANIPIHYGSNIHQTGIRQYGLDPPQEGIIAPAVGIVTAGGGNKNIAANAEDLPEWFKKLSDTADIAEYIGTADYAAGQKRIGLEQPEQGNITLAAGFFHEIFGASVIEAGKEDLPKEFFDKTSKAAALFSIATRTQVHRHLKLAEPEEAKAAFGVGTLQGWSGKRSFSLASPEEAVAEQGMGTLTVKNGKRSFPANSADLPEQYQSVLTDALASEYISTALYTKNTRKTSLTRPEDVIGTLDIGVDVKQNGVKEIEAEKSDLPDNFKDILKDAGIYSYLAISNTTKGYRSIGIVSVTNEEKTKIRAGTAGAITGYVIIGADLNDLNPPTKKKRGRFHIGISHVGAMSIR